MTEPSSIIGSLALTSVSWIVSTPMTSDFLEIIKQKSARARNLLLLLLSIAVLCVRINCDRLPSSSFRRYLGFRCGCPVRCWFLLSTKVVLVIRNDRIKMTCPTQMGGAFKLRVESSFVVPN